jgi:hypothetical protein
MDGHDVTNNSHHAPATNLPRIDPPRSAAGGYDLTEHPPCAQTSVSAVRVDEVLTVH